MSWSILPAELRVEILSRLPFSTATKCREVNRQTRSTVDSHRKRLRRRRIQKVSLSGGDEWTLEIQCKEEKKRKKFCAEYEGTSQNSDCEDAITGIPEDIMCRIKNSASNSEIGTLDLSEMGLDQRDLCSLASLLSTSSIEVLQISMCSLHSLDPQKFLSFLKNIAPTTIRLAWLRHVHNDFFSSEMVDYLLTMENLEVVYFTDEKSKPVKVPISPSMLVAAGCNSFHLDAESMLTQESVDDLVMIMATTSKTTRVRLETKLRPTVVNEAVKVVCDKNGITFITNNCK